MAKRRLACRRGTRRGHGVDVCRGGRADPGAEPGGLCDAGGAPARGRPPQSLGLGHLEAGTDTRSLAPPSNLSYRGPSPNRAAPLMPETPIGPTSQSYISQRLRLHYADWGNAGAPHLILLHGGRDHCRNWDWVAEDLRADYHIIAPDLRGHGDSAWSESGDYSMSAFVYDLAQLIHQQHLAPCRIVAHSLGGNISLRYAGAFPETVCKLVAIEGMGPSPTMMAERAARGAVQR